MTEKKSVLFIMPALPGGGAEKVLIDILRRFDRDRFQLTLLLLFRDDVYTSSIPDDVEVLYLHRRSTLNHERIIRRLRMYGMYHRFVDWYYKPLVRRKLKGRRFDSIVSFMEGAAVRMHSFIMDKGNRNVSWVHIDLKTKHWSKDFFRSDHQERDIYERMDGVAFVSDESRDKFIELFDYDKSNLTTIYNLIPRDEIRRAAAQKDVRKEKFTIILVGRLNSQKRFDRAIDVAKKLREAGSDFEMRIIGEGELRGDLECRIEKYGLAGIVKLLGFRKPPYPDMAIADLYLSTSSSEGYPLTLCEALCLGLPVVSTKTTGPSEILDDSRYGLLVDHDIDSIYNGVKRMIDDEELREMYRVQSEKRSRMFDVEATMNRIVGFVFGDCR